MPLFNLYGVTATLRELLRLNILRISGQDVTVSDLPPDVAEEQQGTSLNLHLYHACEDASKRNDFPRCDASAFPISRLPLPLVLYYVLTAHTRGGNDGLPDAQQRQLLMGLAMKSFHDFPAIDERFQLPVPPAPGAPPVMITVLDPAMRGAHNRIEIIPRQITPEDSVGFWSASQKHTACLTAYYEVRSALLLPEQVSERAGTVTTVMLGLSGVARPTLRETRSIQTVNPPAGLGTGPLRARLSPAVAALGATLGDPPGARVEVVGESLGDGTETTLVLTSSTLTAENPPVTQAVLNPALNPTWQILFGRDSFSFVVQSRAMIEQQSGARALSIRPGVYAVAVRRTRRARSEQGLERTTATESNSVPFAVAPLLLDVTPMALDRAEVRLAPGVAVDAPENDPQLSIAGEVYRFVRDDSDPATPYVTEGPGTFIAAAPNRFQAHLHFAPAAGALYQVQIAINGVDAPPFWWQR